MRFSFRQFDGAVENSDRSAPKKIKGAAQNGSFAILTSAVSSVVISGSAGT